MSGERKKKHQRKANMGGKKSGVGEEGGGDDSTDRVLLQKVYDHAIVDRIPLLLLICWMWRQLCVQQELG